MPSVSMRVLFLMIDGLGDVSVESLGWRTPLEAAEVGALDAIAAAGWTGQQDPVEVGMGCGSDTAHLSILGYPPRTYYRGRGAFEAMGAGLDVQPGEIAFKCNFASMDADGVVTQRRADRDFGELGPPLCRALDGLAVAGYPEHVVAVRYATEHRCAVRVRGPRLTAEISGTDPLKDMLPLRRCEATVNSDEAHFTAGLVNALSDAVREVLEGHPINEARRAKGQPPANVVLMRGAGVRLAVEPFAERHAMPAFMVAPTCIIHGLGMSLGFDMLRPAAATGDYRTDLMAKERACVAAFADPDRHYAFGLLHVKAVDDAGHDRDVSRKVDWLERVSTMAAALLADLAALEARQPDRPPFLICVTGDHSTPCVYGDHSCQPVPFAAARVRDALDHSTLHDSVSNFDEISCSSGCLGRFPGGETMSILRKLAA